MSSVSTAAAPAPRFRSTWAWSLIPIAVLLVAALAANTGTGVAADAQAASSNVTVNATVASNVTLDMTSCGSPLEIAVTQGGFISGSCNVTYGATNNSALPLTLNDSDGAAPFLSGAFVNTAVACDAAMTGDAVGVKVASGGTATNNTCATPTAATTNADYQAMPLTATTVCTTNATGNQTCPIAIGIIETGSDAVAGTYSGIMSLGA